MENETGDYLQVPITENERVAARSRSNSNQRLLPDSSHSSDKDFEKDFVEVPSRFPSIHGDSKSLPSYRSLKPDGASSGQYAPISPIDEENIVHPPPSQQRTVYQSDRSYEPLRSLPDLWQPVWLKRSTLALFALLFTILTVALIVVWVVSENREGFYTKSPHGHKFWQYIPTILLVIIVTLWRQVDYHVKSLIPWDELQKGPVGPKKSLLLDYISPFQIVSLFKAFLHGHIPIVATVSTFILLKIATIFSTGSLILLPTHVTQDDFPLLSTLQFDSSGFNPNNDLSSISSSSVYSYYGSMALGMPWQSGTLADLGYMPVTFDDTSNTRLPANTTLTGIVDAFVPLMDCHEIDAKLDGPRAITQSSTADAYGDGTILFNLPAGDTCGFWAPINVTALNPQTTIAPPRQTSGTLQAVYCSTGNGQVDTSDGPAALLYTVADISYTQDLLPEATLLSGGSFTISSRSSRSVENMVNVICKPSHMIGQVKLSNDTTKDDTQDDGVTIEQLPNPQNRTLNNLPDSSLSSIFLSAISAAQAMFGEVNGGDEAAQASNTIFSLMALSQGQENIDILLDADRLVNAATSTFKGIMAQFARQRLAVPHDTHFRGTATFKETRYRLNEASAVAMITAFGVAAGCSIILIFIGPKKVVPRDPNSIAASATFLARSIEVNRLLRREGVPSERSQQAALEGYEFGTAIATTEGGQSSFKIVTSEGLPETMREMPEKKLTWWHPITASLPFAIIVVLVPLVLIVVLELLQRSSDRHAGIRTVPDDLETDIFTHYIPALVMIIVSSLINLVDFNIELFTPWARLKQGHATHKESILSHYLGRAPPSAFREALRRRRSNVLASLTAVTIAAVLPIVAAGLYNTMSATSTNSGLALNRLDEFDVVQWTDSRTDDRGAAGMLNMILQDDLDYPAFTYMDLVLPKFAIGNGSEVGNYSSSIDSAFAVMPALRPNLRCDAVPASGLNLNTSTVGDSTSESDQATVSVTYTLPQRCQLAGIAGSSSELQYNLAISLPSNGVVFAGRMFDLLFGENASTYGNAGEFNGQYIGNNPVRGCPSLAFTYGEFEMGSTDVSKVSALICYQEIQSIQANVTLRSNTTTIDSSHPPSVDDSRMTLLANPNDKDKVESFDWRLQDNIMRELTSFPADATGEDFDNFFEVALNFNKTHPISPASFVGPNNVNALEETVNTLYRLYMAQAINLNLRKLLPSLSSSTLTRRQTFGDDRLATLTTSSPSVRLTQNRGPKIALQLMLGLISALTAFAYLTTHFRKVLPVNPCSIAGSMSLLAGSDLCHTVDDGVCECCGKPRRNSFGTIAETIHADNDHDEEERPQGIAHGAEWLKMGLFEMVFAGKRYSMGWWKERPQTGKRRRFGVDVGDRADGSDDQDWELGVRASENSGVPFMAAQQEQGVGGRGRVMTAMGRGDRDGRGRYGVMGHSREHSRGSDVGEMEAEVDDGDLGRGAGRRGREYRMVGSGEA